uniref:Envelope polyprotein n=1 Tax=Amphiprion percula TaxID=161767 RepID=A0A3P8SW19_AMPPE
QSNTPFSDCSFPTDSGLTLNYIKNTHITFQFGLCRVIRCTGSPVGWNRYILYMCVDNGSHKCSSWSKIYWSTSTSTSYVANPTDQSAKQMQASISLVRGHLDNHIPTRGHNLLLLTVKPGLAHHYNKLNLVLGVDQRGTDTTGRLSIVFIDPITSNTSSHVPTSTPSPRGDKAVIAFDYTSLTKTQLLTMETGYTGTNLWLDLISSLDMTDCVMCSTARPTLRTVPSPLTTTDFWCMLDIHTNENPVGNCTLLEQYFPMTGKAALPPVFTPISGNHTCITRSGTGPDVGQIPSSWCNSTVNVSTYANCSSFLVARSDCWWYCGGQILRGTLPISWTGTCTIVNLVMPVKHFSLTAHIVAELHATSHSLASRRKRSATLFNPDTFNLEHNSPVYIDAIGIPRGVPNEYKQANQVAAVWESIFLWITPNKNVDRINYIHYNVQRLTNLTRDAIQGVAEQLHATSLMTYQTRMAVDFLLAEQGGVCAMFGDQCCTFIPNNTAPDGSVSKALAGLRSLSNELKERSGIKDPFPGWLDAWFGKWGGLVKSFLMGALIAIALLVVIGCCCIPCARSLCTRMIHTALGPQHPQGEPQMQMQMQMLLLLSRQDSNDTWMDEDDTDARATVASAV